MKALKVGDHIRFLNASGGGVVKKIVGKVAWVEGEDGFELPTPVHECIPVDDTLENAPFYKPPLSAKPSASAPEVTPPEPETEPEPHLLLPEREGADKLSVYLAFLPVDESAVARTPIEMYLINDCNYMLYYTLAHRLANGAYKLISSGTIERDTRIFVEEIALEDIPEREHLMLSLLPYKEEKAYEPKAPCAFVVRVDGMRFLKRHAFRENDFFDDDAIIYPVIEEDVPKAKSESATTPAEVHIVEKEQADAEAKAMQRRRSKQPSQRRKRIGEPPVEVDLHASSLLTTTSGMSNSEIMEVQLAEFRRVMESIKNQPGSRVVFVHGKGEGVLRKAVLDELKQKYPKASAQDASFKEYGFGATLVIIH